MDSKTPLRSVLYGGCASTIAEVLTIPADVLKVRMQLQGHGQAREYKHSLDAIVKIMREEGPLAFTKGLRPAVLRQMTYGSLRFGCYSRLKEVLGLSRHSRESALPQKFLAAGMAGGSSAFVCNPLDLIKVRMQAQGMRTCSNLGSSSSYRGVLQVASRIVKAEGFQGLYTGVTPTATRAMVVAAAEIASYDEIKCTFLRRGFFTDGIALHFATGLVSGFCATAASSPFDVVRSRLMTQPVNEHGVGQLYQGPMDCLRKSWRAEGLRFGWRGFWPNYMCKGPTVVLLFLLYEQIQKHGDLWLDSAPTG